MAKAFWDACTAALNAHRQGNTNELISALRLAETALDSGVQDSALRTKRREHLERIRGRVRSGDRSLFTNINAQRESVDERLFFPRPLNHDLRIKWGISPDRFVVVAVENELLLTKRVAEALGDAVDILNDEDLAVSLIHVSLSPLPVGKNTREHIVQLGSVSSEELPDILAAGDVLFCGLETAPEGAKMRVTRLLECFAMGRPLIMPRKLAGMAVVDRTSAFVLERASVENIITALRTIKTDKALTDRLAKGAVDFYLASTLNRQPENAAEPKVIEPRVVATVDSSAEVRKLNERIARLEQEKHELSIRLRSMPSIDPLCLGDATYAASQSPKEDFGIIVFGHTRLDTLGAVLESLKRQNALAHTEVWLDGYQGNHDLKCKIEKTVELVHTYPVKHLHRQAGNFGFRKMLILGLIEMSKRYRDILVLEDDCFPTRDAVSEFRRELDLIRDDDRIFSIYGHHFLVDSEKDTCARFQGWGWATTAEKLTPMLRQLIDCYSMTEERFLRFVSSTLTAEVKARIDVTYPRQPSYVLENFFAWDETLCLLTALNDQVHKPTRTRTIYNCGMGESSTHFANIEKFRRPPFNLIMPSEVWQYF